MTQLLTKRIVYYALTALIAITFILPLAWAVVNSVSPNSATSQTDGYGLGNYGALAVYGEGISQYLVNSVILTTVAVATCLIAATMAGYAFARFEFRGKGAAFVLILSILMVPYAALLIPLVVWMSELGLDNTLIGVGFVLALFQLPFGTFVMRNAFAGLPGELEEAAKLDGCGTFTTFLRVMLPSAKAPMVTVGLFVFLNAWNDFMVPLYLLGPQNAPLPLAMVNMRQQVMGVIDYGLTTAGVVVLAIPAVILFLALQKYYIKGLISGAVKG